MATKYDSLLPTAKKLIDGLAAKPGIRIADKKIATDNLAQALYGMLERGEVPQVEIKKK